MAAHRKLDRRRDDLYVAGLRKCCVTLFLLNGHFGRLHYGENLIAFLEVHSLY